MTTIEYCGMYPQTPLLGYSYVPYQKKGSVKYPEDIALQRGTVFPALDLPMDIYGKDFSRKCEGEVK